ncbi:MAG TPA: M28 family peptidase [Trueperaceae bacterium]|nr:M28 family peptidase [Trueperaceae bacterium]
MSPQAEDNSAMTHVKHLAETIGPRGSTTPPERQAAEYAAAVMRGAGLEPRLEEFTSPVSGWRPFALGAGVALLVSALLLLSPGPAGGRWLAALLGLVMLATTASVFLEMYFRPNLLRPFVRKGTSQNVWALIPALKPAAAATTRVVLVAHLDTHRTPWVFTRPWRLRLFSTVTALGVAAFVITALVCLAYAATGWSWLVWVALCLAPVHLVVLALTLQPDTTPHTAGANDNASGVGVVLSLAQRLAREPLQHTEVLVLASGCEEVGSVGSKAFIVRHPDLLEGAFAISVDNVGGRGVGVCYTSLEGMVFPLRPSPELFAIAEEIRVANPELEAYSQPYTTLHTDATCFMANGVPSLSFVGLTPGGVIPDWHQVSDVLKNVDPGTVSRTEEFVLRLLRSLDARIRG